MKKKKNSYGYEPKICNHCDQAMTYLLPIDWGTTVIVKAVAAIVRNKKINIVHPTKEMEVSGKTWSYEAACRDGDLTSIQIGNFTKARAHGLIARHDKHAGNWVLTTKGSDFLKKKRISKLAEMEKSRKVEGGRSHKIGYWMPEKYNCTIDEIRPPKGSDYSGWEVIDFEIENGRVVLDLDKPVKNDNQSKLF